MMITKKIVSILYKANLCIFFILWAAVSYCGGIEHSKKNKPLDNLFFEQSNINHRIPLTAEEKLWIKSNPTILFTGDPNWLPYEAFTKKGEYIGIVADNLKLISQKTGLNFKPVITSNWTESLKLAADGKVAIISGDVADVILNQKFLPVDAYSHNPIVIVMDNKQYYVENLEKIKDKEIAIIKDYGYTSDIYKTYQNN